MCKKDEVLVFSDPVAAYNIYYYNCDKTFVISNCLYDLASVIKEKLTVNELNIIEQVTEYAILGGENYFNEIFRLDGEHTIQIRNGNIELIDNGQLFRPYQEGFSLVDSAKELAKQIECNASIFYKTFGDPDICMTGGGIASIRLKIQF